MMKNRIVFITAMGILANKLTYAQSSEVKTVEPKTYDSKKIFICAKTAPPDLVDIKKEKFRKEQNKFRARHHK
jgi:hypothetical protein